MTSSVVLGQEPSTVRVKEQTTRGGALDSRSTSVRKNLSFFYRTNFRQIAFEIVVFIAAFVNGFHRPRSVDGPSLLAALYRDGIHYFVVRIRWLIHTLSRQLTCIFLGLIPYVCTTDP